MRHLARPVVFLSPSDVRYLMRINRITIRELSRQMQITQKRIRQVRETGLADRHSARDWIEAITGHDPGLLARPWTRQQL